MRTAGTRFKGVQGTGAHTGAFRIKSGTAPVNGESFISNGSKRPDQKLRGVPDRAEGDRRLLRLYMR